MQSGGYAGLVPEFDELFRIPAEAKADEVEDENGNVLMPSRSQFEAARLDALVLTYNTLDGLRTGRMTPDSAIRELEGLRDALAADAENSPFDRLAIGGGEFMQVGENEPLIKLLEQACEKLRNVMD